MKEKAENSCMTKYRIVEKNFQLLLRTFIYKRSLSRNKRMLILKLTKQFLFELFVLEILGDYVVQF